MLLGVNSPLYRLKLKDKYLYLLLVCSSSLWAQTISLEEILEYASANAGVLKIKEIDALIESKNVDSSMSAYYPTLNVVYNNEYTESLDGIPLGTESIGGITISNGTRYQSSLALQLNYDLYHFGSTDKRVAIASHEFEIKRVEWCSQEKELHQQILERYVSARKASIEKEYRQEMLNLRRELYAIKERLYNAGKYSKVDLGDEAIYMIALERDIENLTMGYQEDIIRLSQLSYMEFNKPVVLLPLNTNVKKVSLRNYDKTTEGIILKKRIEQKKDEISLAFREQLPSVGVYSNYYMYGSNPTEYDNAITEIENKSWNIGIALRMNIFEGFKHSSNDARLKLELHRLELELSDAQHNYSYEVDSKTTRLSELSTLKEHEQHLLEENHKKREMVNRLRKLKRVDSITQINTEYELIERELNIKIREIEAEFEHEMLNILNRGINECTQH